MVNLIELKVLRKDCINLCDVTNNAEHIDVAATIKYKVAVKNDFYISSPGDVEFKYEFDSFIFLKIPLGHNQDINNISCAEFEYTIENSQLPEVKIQDYELLRRENKKAIKLVKEYLKTEEFKRKLIKEI